MLGVKQLKFHHIVVLEHDGASICNLSPWQSVSSALSVLFILSTAIFETSFHFNSISILSFHFTVYFCNGLSNFLYLHQLRSISSFRYTVQHSKSFGRTQCQQPDLKNISRWIFQVKCEAAVKLAVTGRKNARWQDIRSIFSHLLSMLHWVGGLGWRRRGSSKYAINYVRGLQLHCSARRIRECNAWSLRFS